MSNRNQELIFSGIVLLLVIRNIMRPEKTTWNWVMIAVGVALLIRQGYIIYESRK
jgi:uncharacterized membrane protein YobD (UPF0266 family)